MKKSFVSLMFLFSIVLIFGLFGNAEATLFTYDFSASSVNGQSYEGVTLDYMTLTSQSGDMTYQSSYGGIGANYSNGNTSDIYLTFSTPINSISVKGGDGGGDADAFSLYLYAFGTNALIGRYDTPLFDGNVGPVYYTLAVSAPNIGYIVFDPGNSGVLPGQMGSPYGGVLIADIGYNTAPVPEPATILLLGSGLVGLWGARRKFKK